MEKKGEKLGMHLRVETDGRVIVTSVLESSAAFRASNLTGLPCPVKIKDQIIEINGVCLNVSLYKLLFLIS
jgi:hypothetical protein